MHNTHATTTQQKNTTTQISKLATARQDKLKEQQQAYNAHTTHIQHKTTTATTKQTNT